MKAEELHTDVTNARSSLVSDELHPHCRSRRAVWYHFDSAPHITIFHVF
jgi:hypothetical protein